MSKWSSFCFAIALMLPACSSKFGSHALAAAGSQADARKSGIALLPIFIRFPTSEVILGNGQTPLNLVPTATLNPPSMTPGGNITVLTPAPLGTAEISTTPSPISLHQLAPLTLKNATNLVQAGEISFSPWDLVMAVAWSPDGKILAISAGENLHLYRIDEHQPLASTRIGAFTHSLAFSPDGRWLASGSRDGLLRLWEVNPFLQNTDQVITPRFTIQAHRKGVNSVSFSPDGQSVASGGNDAVARFWDVETGALIGMTIGGTFAVPSIAFTPNGAALAIVNGEVIRLREVGTERILGTLMADTPLYNLAFSPDGRWLAVGDTDNLVRLWDPARTFHSGSEIYPEPVALTGHNGTPGSYRALIWQVAFNPDGILLASAGGDATLRVWDVGNAKLLITLNGHTAGVTCIAFHPSGNSLVSGSLDGTVKLWGVKN